MQTEKQLLQVLPASVSLLAVVPPIETRASLHRRRLMAIVTVTAVVVAFVAEALFLLKIKPIM